MRKDMWRKGIVLGMMVLFVGASVVPSITGYDKNVEKIDYIQNENETLNMKNDDYNNLIKQVIESGVISKNDWLEQDKLLASDGAAGDRFGESVSIDGDYAIIGAPWDGGDSGSAYIFTRNDSTWTQQQKLPSPNSHNRCFGCSVSISGDTAIVGAPFCACGWSPGVAYIFTRSGTSWTQQAELVPSGGWMGDYFGWSVSIDGDYAIVGAPFDGDYWEEYGAAYVFKRDGTSWIQQDKLIASDGADLDFFGYSVSIDGDYAIVGSIWDADNGYESGSAYIFTRNGSNWTEQTKLLASDGAGGDWFGCSVSIKEDSAIVGAKDGDGNVYDSGSAYIFTRNGSNWTEQAKLFASDGAAWDKFGWSVSIDGDYAIVGAGYDDDNGERSGSAYVFIKNGGNQSPEITDVMLTTSNPLDTEPGFGWENFSCTVIDDGTLDIVQLNLTYTKTYFPPDPWKFSTEYFTFPMNNIPGTDVYYYHTTLTAPGEYTYHIWANDTNGNQNSTLPEPFFLPKNSDVDMGGRVHFMDLVAVARRYGDEGPPGWCREDIDNNGIVHFMDLICISYSYGWGPR